MDKYFKGIGICISISSLMAFANPLTCHFTLPVVFALGCLVYGMGVVIDTLKKSRE